MILSSNGISGLGPRIAAVLLAAILSWSAEGRTPVRGGGDKPAGKKLLIVAPDAFHRSLSAFAEHKRALLPTELVSLETILRRGRGADDPEKLKRYLYREWRERGAGYVLLVGDIDVLPVRYMVLDRVTPAAFDYAFYPSDHYYGDLAREDGSFDDWNARKDSFHAGYFGEVRGEKNKDGPINFDGVDYLPDIAVGRWPVSTPEEVRVVAAKSVSYERSVLAGDSPHLRRAALLAVSGWVDTRGMLDRQADKLTDRWEIQKRYYSDKRRISDTMPPDAARVRELFDSGIGFVIHTGHGQTDHWEKSFTLRDLDRISNADSLSVVLSASCLTAAFAPMPPYDAYVDVKGVEHRGTVRKQVFTEPPPPPSPYQRGRFNPTGLGEQMLKRNASGAAAYIGCNTGSQPCGLTLVEGFVDALAAADEPRLGDCWADAIRHYHKKERLADLKPTPSWYPPSVFFQAMKFMVFGDPSLRLPGKR